MVRTVSKARLDAYSKAILMGLTVAEELLAWVPATDRSKVAPAVDKLREELAWTEEMIRVKNLRALDRRQGNGRPAAG